MGFGTRLFATMVLAGVASHAAAADDADKVANGHQLALEICSACHIAGPDQKTPPILTQPPPSLEALANKPGATALPIVPTSVQRVTRVDGRVKPGHDASQRHSSLSPPNNS
jgi:mono/diheme cytochrome c family protein